MPHYKKRRKRKDPKRNLKLALLVGLPVAALLSGGIAINHYMGVERISEDFCFDRPDQREVGVLIDNSVGDSVSQRQFRDYQTGLDQAFAVAKANTRFVFFSTAQGVSGSIASPMATICKPASSVSELENLGAPSKPPTYIARQASDAKTEYDAIVARVIRDTLDAGKLAKDSPILEQNQAVSRSPDFQGRYRSLIVLTDGIQNSETARFCSVKGDLPPFSTFKQQRRYSFVKPDSLDGVDVHLMLIESLQLPSPLLPYCTWPEVRRFWMDYYSDNGASNVRLTRLRYGS